MIIDSLLLLLAITVTGQYYVLYTSARYTNFDGLGKLLAYGMGLLCTAQSRSQHSWTHHRANKVPDSLLLRGNLRGLDERYICREVHFAAHVVGDSLIRGIRNDVRRDLCGHAACDGLLHKLHCHI